jgi:hypothetical protein
MTETISATDKSFFDLRARLALRGFTLARTDGRDGPVRYYAGFRNNDRCLHSLSAVESFARQVGAGASQ